MGYDRRQTPAERRRFLGLVALGSAALGVSACGFTPLYGRSERTGGNASVDGLRQVFVATIPERTGQILRKELQIQLAGGRAGPRQVFELRVDLGEKITRQALLDDDSASFARLDLVARYRLIDVRDGSLATSGESVSSSSYNVVQSQFANLSAEDGAREHAALLIASDITRRLALYFRAA